MKFSIGIDIGGTNTAIGLVSEEGDILERIAIPTTGEADVNAYTTRLTDIVNRLRNNKVHPEIIGIGIGAPAVNHLTGVIEGATNLPWPSPIPLRKMMEERALLPVSMANDANAAAIGEMTYGVAKSMHDFIYITLGTGVGSGIVCDGRLLSGVRGLAGELGHVVIDPDSKRMCACGRNGCLQTYCSASGIVTTAIELLDGLDDNSSLRDIPSSELSSRDIGEAARKGDKIAIEALRRTGEILGFACAQFAAFSSPEAIILFGGPTRDADLLTKPLIESFQKNALFLYRDSVRILLSNLPADDAAILGAASLPYSIN